MWNKESIGRVNDVISMTSFLSFNRFLLETSNKSSQFTTNNYFLIPHTLPDVKNEDGASIGHKIVQYE